MNESSLSYKNYLLSINPCYQTYIICLLISFIIIFISLFYFKTYDIYNTKGYLECSDTCHIIINIDPYQTNKVTNIDYLKINDKVIKHHNIKVEDIVIDENNQINYQIVKYEVDQLDDGLLNTFQDIKLYSKYEAIIKKIVNVIM